MDAPGARVATAAPGPGRKELKIVIVGDGGCGKTSLLMVYSQGSFPEHYAPSVFDKYTASVTVGSKEVTLNLYDTAGECACALGVPGVRPPEGFPSRGIPHRASAPCTLAGPWRLFTPGGGLER
ncbi:hypothetical protein P7K49_020464 [Saguinus oedipus]|uniref:Uncharacterized protein n=1 Tax=Saguinus oedipus TaxID=9490 RepID=A0ABQ9V0C7_SAGOE|nr:hypothetical protein P7K49_020464 [Saguinus oedipus]